MRIELSREDVINLLETAEFKYAKTMPKFPHFYTLRKTWMDDAKFDGVVNFIRTHGEKRTWGGRKYIYLIHDNNQYWTMGNPIQFTKLINRSPL